MDEYQKGSFCSNYVDDVFFILKNSLKRSLSFLEKNTSLNTVKHGLNTLSLVIGSKMDKNLNSFTAPDGSDSLFCIALNDCLAVKQFVSKTIKDFNIELQSHFSPQIIKEWVPSGVLDSEHHAEFCSLLQNFLDKYSDKFDVRIVILPELYEKYFPLI